MKQTAPLCTPADYMYFLRVHFRYVRFLQRAHQISFQQRNWENEPQLCEMMMVTGRQLAEGQTRLATMVGEERALQLRSSARLMLRSLVSALNNRHQRALVASDSFRMKFTELQSLLATLAS